MYFLDTDSVMVQFRYPGSSTNNSDILDYYYRLCKQVAIKGTSLFPSPNILEFETMKYPFWLSKKKNYAAMEYPEDTWRTKPKLVIKGLPFKKRDRCPFVRKVGYRVMGFILTKQSHLIHQYVKNEMEALIRNDIPYNQLAITCTIQAETDYKSKNLIQLETAKKTTMRTGTHSVTGSRLAYVVVQGSRQLYLRGEDPVYAEKHNMKLDILYYLDKQLLGAIEPLLRFHPGVDISGTVAELKQELTRRSSGVVSLLSMAKRIKTNKN
jgi:DNA polymerase elongation subunit (family B)